MFNWKNIGILGSRSYICGHCELNVAGMMGFNEQNSHNIIYICPHCNKPTFFGFVGQMPSPPFGGKVGNLPMNIENLFNELRNCAKVGAYTGSVLLCRKLLMNVAVQQGAPENKTFVFYVEYLAQQGFIPSNAKSWVDHIRSKGNEANHEIVLMSQQEAEDLIVFAEMLLKIIYEFPNRTPSISSLP